MANEREVYDVAMAGYQAAIAEQSNAYQQAQLSGDFQESVRASQELASLRVAQREFHQMAVENAQSMRPMKQNPHNLTDLEVEIAKAAIPDRKDAPMTVAEKIDSYATQKAKLHEMRRTGEYRQTTDRTG
jgi:hypothetical protein